MPRRTGSSASALQRRVVQQLRARGAAGLRELRDQVTDLARANALTYTQDDGTTEVMPILLAPTFLSAADVAYLQRLCRTLLGAFARTARARRTDPEVRAILPLEPDEEEWLALDPARPGPTIARFDLNIDPARGGARAADLLEMNGCAVGGIHYGPATSQTVLPHVAGEAPRRRVRLPGSMSEAWLDLVRAQAKRLGRRDVHVVWLEDRDWEVGITEGPTLVERTRGDGVTASLADPRELRLSRDGEILLGRRPVDIVYRAIELRDILAIEREHGTLRALREAVRRGRVLSPIQGDLDHKSLLEVWSAPRFARLFTAAERAAMRRHVPWTRLLGERRTEGPDGRAVDLAAYARRRRAKLVLKPNRSCGGEGILIGRDTAQTTWERAVARGVRGSAPAVVQSLVQGATLESPELVRGRVVLERHYTNYGLLSSARRLGVLGRAAPFPVVNVSRGGGVLGVLVV
ncbi:MAG TPA: hypothetical protein VMZ28_29820 [Kofleriaceae bacterium]|nr:hypothetical protein [Kofleriaceae bacterium]